MKGSGFIDRVIRISYEYCEGRLNLTSILFERLKVGVFEAKYVKQEREKACVYRLLLKVIVLVCRKKGFICTKI